MRHHHSPPFAACESKKIGSDKPNESCYPERVLTLLLDTSQAFTQAKRVRGSGSPPLLASLAPHCFEDAHNP